MRRPWIPRRTGTSLGRPTVGSEEGGVGSPVLLLVAVVAVMAVIAFVTFLVAIKGRERTLVPDVQGMDLLEALPELQDRGLQYVVSPVFSSEAPRNSVISQRPSPGAVVKQGRQVELSVSRGAVLDRVPNYVGWTLAAVRENLGAVFSSSYVPLLRVAEPPSYVNNAAPEGTILQQDPAAGVAVSGVTDLHFVVSLGPEATRAKVGDFVGLSYAEAVSELSQGKLGFLFTVDTGRRGEPGQVLRQSPEAGSMVPPDSLVQLWIQAPSIDEETEVFSVFQREMPVYAVRVPVRLEVDSREAPATLFSMEAFPGGLLTVPYVARKNDELVLLVDDREVARVAADPERR